MARYYSLIILFENSSVATPYQRKFRIKMSKAMIPLSTDALHRCTMLFNLSKPVTMSPKIFDGMWSYVDPVYAKPQPEQYPFRNISTYRLRWQCH